MENREYVYILNYTHPTKDLVEMGLTEKKIGKASGETPENRVKGLNANSPIGLEIEKAWQINAPYTALQVESAIHQLLHHDRQRDALGTSWSEFFNDDNEDLASRVGKFMKTLELGTVWENKGVTTGKTDYEWERRIGKNYVDLRDGLLARGFTKSVKKGYVAFEKDGYIYNNVMCINRGGKMDFHVQHGTDFDGGHFLFAKNRGKKDTYAAAFKDRMVYNDVSLPALTVDHVIETVESLFEAQSIKDNN